MMAENPSSAFLDRLLARAVGTAEVVEPRLPSVFEPMRVPRVEDSVEWMDDAPMEVTRAAPAARGVFFSKHGAASRPAAGPGEAPADVPRVEPPSRSRAAVLSEPPQAPRAAGLPALAVAAARLSERAAPPEDPAPPTFVARARRAAAQATADRRVTPAPGFVELPPATRLPTASRFAPVPGFSKVESAGSAELLEESAARFAMPGEHPPRGALLPIASRALPSMPSGAPRSRRAAEPEASNREAGRRDEPVVNVTIGRVEVRAVAEPARAPRPKPPAGAASLEEYLKTHARAR